jgi:hypothetical protein
MATQPKPRRRAVVLFFIFSSIGIGSFIIGILALTEVIETKPGAWIYGIVLGVINLTAAPFIFLQERKKK